MGSGGQCEDDTESSVAGITPHTTRLFGTVTPEPDNTLTTHRRPHHRRTIRRAAEPLPKTHLTQRGFVIERVGKASDAGRSRGMGADRGFRYFTACAPWWPS